MSDPESEQGQGELPIVATTTTAETEQVIPYQEQPLKDDDIAPSRGAKILWWMDKLRLEYPAFWTDDTLRLADRIRYLVKESSTYEKGLSVEEVRRIVFCDRDYNEQQRKGLDHAITSVVSEMRKRDTNNKTFKIRTAYKVGRVNRYVNSVGFDLTDPEIYYRSTPRSIEASKNVQLRKRMSINKQIKTPLDTVLLSKAPEILESYRGGMKSFKLLVMKYRISPIDLKRILYHYGEHTAIEIKNASQTQATIENDSKVGSIIDEVITELADLRINNIPSIRAKVEIIKQWYEARSAKDIVANVHISRDGDAYNLRIEPIKT